MSYALILLAHGSSDPNWRAPFEHFAEALTGRLSTPLHLAYMELSEPSLESTVAELADAGVERAEILPLFFAAGRHLRKDVPGQVEALNSAHPGIDLTLLPPVGQHPAFVEALAAVVAEQAGESARS
ncbi:cobalamin biosynthesis protein CbiX [Halomonas aestuarii]|uniref:Cobalamin biosynthesis protein CbiX n=1 Tax=Halomonas aestuarii TaxID=1897729 RepID=A0A1J0VGG2_9GAMM|nr:CbiX/SirB N-terminal domain-containing protein [Halomonas aestuarii]APE31113.1 cobalamin biosynthesis protein CbiX [Halomonas aestuarii]